jgi:hypothetical protein
MKKTVLFACALAICLPVAVFSQTLDGKIKTAITELENELTNTASLDFEFANPVQALREIKEDVRKSGGTFEGNNSEGFYVLHNEKVTYKVQGKILTLFTRLPPEAISRSATRGISSPLKIDLTMPRSKIPQQITLTGDKIKQAGGIFSGDVSGGRFEVQKPVEIIGNYQVANESVTVLITQYPSLFAGTIKSKIKEYFGE